MFPWMRTKRALKLSSLLPFWMIAGTMSARIAYQDFMTARLEINGIKGT